MSQMGAQFYLRESSGLSSALLLILPPLVHTLSSFSKGVEEPFSGGGREDSPVFAVNREVQLCQVGWTSEGHTGVVTARPVPYLCSSTRRRPLIGGDWPRVTSLVHLYRTLPILQ